MSDVVIQGAGWVTGRESGSVFRGDRVPYGEGAGLPPWKDPALFPVAARNIGRFDAVSRLVLSACALALRDAGLTLEAGVESVMGIIGTNEDGCLPANRRYFEDYLAGGRILARANLFVNTLPTSPLAEAAIHFRLRGPLLYCGCPGGGLGVILNEAANWILADVADQLLVVRADERDAVAFLVGRGGTGPGYPVTGLPREVAGGVLDGDGIARLERLAKGSDNA